ncbi:hypothetical protein BCV70DRAFT_217672 [Testicularia cyperi]|uniref:Uncharacterized protein n=1 Tax=Testicularia cyperi TaxID=1882483 RepID=A0A317XPK3_9BASI|nr:hypothetical protein BCV70DRAFT_217672 [Testicularia cyperi]
MKIFTAVCLVAFLVLAADVNASRVGDTCRVIEANAAGKPTKYYSPQAGNGFQCCTSRDMDMGRLKQLGNEQQGDFCTRFNYNPYPKSKRRASS